MTRMFDSEATGSGGAEGSLRPVLRGALHLLSGQSVRLISQSLYLVLLTRSLGADSYSKVTALLALFVSIYPFTCLGTPLLVLRGVARSPEQRARHWGAGLAITVTLGLLASLLLAFVAPRLLGIDFPRLPLFLFATAELVGFGIIQVLNGVQQGEERLGRVAVILALLSVLRLGIMAAVQFVAGLDLARFSYAYFAGSMLTLTWALAVYARHWGRPVLPRRIAELRAIARDGIHVSLAASGRSLLLGLDKMMLPALFGLTAAAQYGAAMRVVMFAFIPLQSLLVALLPRLFQEGGRSLKDGLQIWRRTAPLGMAYALSVALLIFLAAPLIQTVLGPEFSEVADVLRRGVWLLILLALYQPLGDALTGADFFAYRSFSLIVAVACNFGLNAWLIPRHGWRGALLAAYAANLLLLALYALRVRKNARQAHEA